jgi:hypothetical protein
MTVYALGDETWVRILGPLGGAAITGIITLAIWWLNRQRPNKVQVRESGVTSLLRIAETMKPRIAATLDGQAVAGLSQLELVITNSGPETIKNIRLLTRAITVQHHDRAMRHTSHACHGSSF